MKKYDLRCPAKGALEPISEPALAAVSSAMARPLPFPEDYVDFLRQWNGLIFPDDGGPALYLDVEDEDDDDDDAGSIYLDCLYGLGDPSNRYDLRSHDHELEGNLPNGLIVIGEYYFGTDRICMSLARDSYGHIMLLRREDGWWPEIKGCPQVADGLLLVAKSFGEFWEMLEPQGESDVDQQLGIVSELKEMTARALAALDGPDEDGGKRARDILLGADGGPSATEGLNKLMEFHKQDDEHGGKDSDGPRGSTN